MQRSFSVSERGRLIDRARSLSRQHIICLCSALHAALYVFAISTFLFPRFSELRDAQKAALHRALQVRRLEETKGELGAVRGELAQVFLVQSARSNDAFQHLHALVDRAGGLMRSFEQVGRGSEQFPSSGFTRIEFDTNFLQFETLLDSLANKVPGVSIKDFTMRSTGPPADRISFYLVISSLPSSPSDSQMCRR